MASRLPASAKSIVISVNPRAGAKSAVARVRPVELALAERGYEVFVTTDLEQVQERAAQWSESGELRAVVAAGGDGTASAVRNVVSPDTPLLPLPLGTECLLAKHIRQTEDPQAVCETVEGGLTVKMDIGRVDSRFFLLMLSVGFDAEVVHRMQDARVGNITHAAYVRPVFQAIRSYKYPELRVYCDEGYCDEGDEKRDEKREPISCRWLLGFNLPCYARGMPFAADADCADGLLDICAFERGRLWNSLRYFWNVYRAKHHLLPDVKKERLRKFRVEAVDGSAVAVQVDGDRAGRLPIDVEVVPSGLTLMVSAAGAERLGFSLPGKL